MYLYKLYLGAEFAVSERTDRMSSDCMLFFVAHLHAMTWHPSNDIASFRVHCTLLMTHIYWQTMLRFIKFLIAEFSKEEEGVRTLIRTVETLVTRINLLRIAGETTAKKYSFYTAIKLPLTITPDLCRRILEDTVRSGNESFRHMYT
jgi:hypothetical protein